MNKMLISRMVQAKKLPGEVKGDLPVTPDTILRVTVEIPSGQRPPRLNRQDYLAAIHRISDHVRSLPLLDDRSLEDMLYDECGLPK